MGKILLTGLNGFIGKNLLQYIKEIAPGYLKDLVCLSSTVQEGIDTIVYSNKGSDYLFYLPGDIDIVIHLGAYIPKSHLMADRVDLSNSNIDFTSELLRQLSSTVKRFVFISTIDVYGEDTIISEETPINPVSLYGASKFYCERMIECWAKEFNVDYKILRLGHIYGKGEDAYKKLIPIFINNILNNKPITIFSNGEEKRAFLNVKDCVRYIWKYAVTIKTIHNNSIINIVSGTSYEIKDIARMLVDISGKKIEIKILNENIKTKNYLFNNDKMKEFIEYKEISLYDGLKEEYDYFKKKNETSTQ